MPKLIVQPKFLVPFQTSLYTTSTRKIWDRYTGKMPTTVVDIGAHIGAFGLLLACNGVRFVQMVEADHDNYQLLLGNIGVNQCWARALPTHMAVSDVSFEVAGLHRMTGSSGVRSLASDYKDVEHDTVPVWTISVEDLIGPVIEKFGSVDILKMDIEGGEWKALAPRDSLTQKLKRVKYLDVECHPTDGTYNLPTTKVDDLLKYLTSVGFQVNVQEENHICGFYKGG